MRTETQSKQAQIAELVKATESLMLATLMPTTSEPLDALMRYHLESPGSQVRARLALHAGVALRLSAKTTIAIAACCELIHNASLLHDDIQDQDPHRRGRQAAWARFGINSAMGAGTMMLSAAYSALSEAQGPVGQLIQHVHRRTAALISAQDRDLSSTQAPIDLAAYLQIAAGKSGSLLALPLELTLLASDQQANLDLAQKAGESFALAYQMIDDMKDFERDRLQGSNNVLSVLQASGQSPEDAFANAHAMASSYLDQATECAQSLAHNSGDYLCELSLDLANAIAAPRRKTVHAA